MRRPSNGTLALTPTAYARYVAEHDVDVDRVFTHTWSLDDAPEAFRLCDAQIGAKAAILPNGGP